MTTLLYSLGLYLNVVSYTHEYADILPLHHIAQRSIIGHLNTLKMDYLGHLRSVQDLYEFQRL